MKATKEQAKVIAALAQAVDYSRRGRAISTDLLLEVFKWHYAPRSRGLDVTNFQRAVLDAAEQRRTK